MAIFNSPHPLLDNVRGNFEYNTFNCELAECKVENGIYHFYLTAEIDEENILDLIEQGDVSFAVKIESPPFFVKTWKANKDNPLGIKIEISYETVSADLYFELTPLIVSNKEIVYKNVNANPPMNEYNFNLSAHQIIGSHPTLKLSFERGYRKIVSGPLIKVVKLKPPLLPKAGTMDINLNDDDHIHVQISELNYERFRQLNSVEPKLLDALITLPVLQYTLSELLYGDSAELRDKRWAKILDEEYHVFDMKTQDDVLRKCDEMLNSAIPAFVDYFDRKYLDK
jgi:hypothetical protein